MTQPLKVAVSAGEVSGDEHLARVVAGIRGFHPDVSLRGMGGRNLRLEGVDTIVDSETSASVMGFLEVAAALRQIAASLSCMKRLLADWRPDLLVVCDYQDFHFRLIRTAHELKIPVLFFISPTVWAWRPGRIALVERYVDIMASIYPFEPAFYENYGCHKVVYVGHPFAEHSKLERMTAEEKSLLRERLGVRDGKPVALFLPGSRKREVRSNLPIVAKTIELLLERHPDLHALVSVAPGIDKELFSATLSPASTVVVTDHPAAQLMQISDAGLLKSGTSNLQAAFCGLPFAMTYQANFVAEIIVRTLVRVRQFSMVNVIEPGAIREFVQRDAKPEAMVDELVQLLFDSTYRASVLSRLGAVRDQLSSYDPRPEFRDCSSVYERVARLALSLCDLR